MNAERGFRRLTVAVSLVILISTAIANAIVNDMGFWYRLFWERLKALEFPRWVEWFAVGFPLGMAVIPWVLYYLIRWVARGFKGST